MKKSIYSRLIVMFILTIILGTIFSFILIYNLYFNKIYDQFGKVFIDIGEDISILYKTTPKDEFDRIMGIKIFSDYYIEIYEENKIVKTYGEKIENGYASSEIKQAVKDRRIFYNKPKLSEFKKFNKREEPILIYPFENNGKNNLIIIYPGVSEVNTNLIVLLEINLLVMILTGIIIFAIVGRMIVKRIKILTKASRQVAKGNYNVVLEDNGDDELGELIKTFDTMVKKIDKTEQMRKEFVSNVSHEIQSPITSIMGFANILQSDYINEDDKKQYLKIIAEESRRLSGLSANLLRLASLENDQDILNKSKYYLDEQIRRVVLMLQPKWEDKNIEFDLILPQVQIYADVELMEQVWINIIGNSIKFSNENSKIYIQIRKYDCVMDISIKDEGIGISEEDLGKIFDRFHQADLSRKVSGSGLGLSIARKIVILHEGNIRVKSKLSQGTEFIISFRV